MISSLIPSAESSVWASTAWVLYFEPYIRWVEFVCLHKCAIAGKELLMESNKAVKPSLASAISSRDSSIAVDVRTAMTRSGGVVEEVGWRFREA